MKINAYLKYYDINSDDFNSKDDFYKSTDEYVNAINASAIPQNAPYKLENKSQEDDDKMAYAKCEAMLFNKDGLSETVDDFISDYVSKDVQLYMLNFNLGECDPDFEQELNLWYTEHYNLQRYAKDKGDDWILRNEPKRNLAIDFVNKAGETKYAELVDCKIMEKQKSNIYILLVQQVNLIEKFN